MSKPIIHARSSSRRWGGTPDDYIEIHDLMDSSKAAYGDNRHRTLTHNSWFLGPNGPLERIFGKSITNSDGKEVSVRDIGEQHVAEDFGGYIPNVQDYLDNMRCEGWMCGKGRAPSAASIARNKDKAAVRDILKGNDFLTRID